MGKKISKVLKGVVITGAAVGGFSAFGNANLVFASEDVSTDSTTGSIDIQLGTTTSTDTTTAITDTTTTNTNTVENTNVATNQADTQTDTQTVAQTVDYTDIDSLNTVDELEDAIEVANADIAAENTNIQQAEADIAKANADIEDAVEERTDLQAQLQTATNTYNNAGYNNADLQQLQQQVDALMVQEAAGRQAVIDNPSQNYLTVSNYYRDYGRPLAKAMIKYYLVYTGEVTAAEVDNIEIGEWFDNGYFDKHFCIRYINPQGELTERYFDYVTADSAGNPMIKETASDRIGDIPSEATGITVLEKTPTYAYYEDGDNTKLVAVENTSANRTTYKTQLNSKKMKTKDFSGNSYLIAQRNGWSTEKAEDSVKGAVKIHLNSGKEAVELSAVIQELTNEIQEINSKIDLYNNTITTRTADKAGYEATIENISNAIDNINAKITELTAPQTSTMETAPVTTGSVASASQTSVSQTVASQTRAAVAQTNTADLAIDNVLTAPTAGVQQEVSFQQPAASPVQAIEEVRAPLAVVDLESPEEAVEITTVHDQDVAKSIDLVKASAVWNGSALPLVGALTAFFGFTKLKRETQH